MKLSAAAFSLFLLVLIVQLFISLAQVSPEDFVAKHNVARSAVGVGPIWWDDKVAAYAQAYASKRVADCAMNSSGGPYGENFAGGYGVDQAIDAVGLWLAEKDKYEYESNKCINGTDCSHYTQIVWRDSVSLGCGEATCGSGWNFVVCNYDPPGNIKGQRPY